MKMKSTLRKIFLIILPSFLIFLFLLEISLRIGGILYTRYRSPERFSEIATSDKDTFNILCLGDSFTYGLGSTPGHSYPAWLERELNAKGSSMVYRVHNGGKIGSNSSSVVLKQLREAIPKNIPDLVIVMTGCNNRWLLTESTFFHLMGHRNTDPLGMITGRIDNLLGGLRTYKLIKIAIFRIQYKKISKIIESGTINVSLRQPDQEREIGYKDDINVELATYSINGDYALAKAEIKKALKNPGFVSSVFNIGTAVNYMLWASREDKKEFFKEIDSMKEIVKATYDRATYTDVNEILDALVYLAIKMEIPAKILRSDLLEVHRIAMNYGIDLILMTYPCGISVMDDTIRRLSKEFNIILVDNQKIFEDRLKIQQKRELFVDDGHCNDQGYKLMAQNICEVLIRDKFVSAH